MWSNLLSITKVVLNFCNLTCINLHMNLLVPKFKPDRMMRGEAGAQPPVLKLVRSLGDGLRLSFNMDNMD